jgi:glucose/arabinose dehydrogenase
MQMLHVPFILRPLAGALLLAWALAACGAAEEPAPTTAPAEEATPTQEMFMGAAGDIPPAGEPLEYALDVPDGFRISTYAEGLGEVRKIAFDEEGVPHVTIMNRNEPGTGSVLALPDRDDDGMADEVVSVLEPLDRPHGLVFHEGSMYVSEPHRILRLIDEDNDLTADDTETVITGMPAEGDHWSRPFVFTPENGILVAIGSSCNATCLEADPRRATIWQYAPDGSEIGAVAAGLRSVVDMDWNPANGDLWVVNNGRDFADLEPPVPDTAYKIGGGEHHGWPYCLGDGRVDQEVANRGDRPAPEGLTHEEFCSEVVEPGDMVLPAHVAPLGLTFYTAEQFPAEYQSDMFMAWHGAFDFANTNGYRIVHVPMENGEAGEPESFISWVMPDESGWFGRPVDVQLGPEGSLYVSDDFNGNVYRIDYIGDR